MRPEEIAMQLTMKALETGHISHRSYPAKEAISQEWVKESNQLIAEEIGKFYQRMLSAVRGSDEFKGHV